MRGSTSRRILSTLVGILAIAVIGFLAVGLLFEDSWPGQMVQGAGFVGGAVKDPTVFPSQNIVSEPFEAPQNPTGGGSTTQVTFVGLWGGYCSTWGTDPDHSNGVEYNAGTFKMTVDGQNWQSYCIDVHHTIRAGDSYQANVHAGAEPGLCEAHWILANYSRDNPGLGLSSAEEGVAIQAALWHYVEGFQPVWDADRWCKKQAVFQRAMEIINAAQGKCLPIPADIDLTASPTTLEPGETSNLLATVTDQRGNGYPGQTVTFSATPGSALGSPTGVTDGAGQSPNTFTYDGQGTQTATANMSGQIGTGVVDPINAPKQRIMVIKPITYSGEDSVDVTWESAPTAVFLNSFEAKIQLGSAQGGVTSGGVLLRWETASEINNLGFNVYRGTSNRGPWIKLNGDLIPSQSPGSATGAQYEFLDSKGNPRSSWYLLEDVDLNGTVTQHGPVQPTP